jgi:hypothetical protein
MTSKISAFVFFATGLLFLTSCIVDPNEKITEKAKTDKDFVTQIEWLTDFKNFGKIDEGQKLEVIFEYKNVGEKPLVIKNVQASCGCTVPEIPKEPVMPGKTGMLKAVFDSQGRAGENNKTITVYSNTTPGIQELNFSVNVIGKEEKKS